MLRLFLKMQRTAGNRRGVNECTEPDDVTPMVTEKMSSAETKNWKMQHRSAMVQLLGGLYGLAIVTLGLVFSLAAALTFGYQTKSGKDSYYLEVFQIFLYTLSLVFLAYLHAYLLRPSSSSANQSLSHSDKPETEEGEKSGEKIDLEEIGDSGDKSGGCTEESRSKSAATTPIPNTRTLTRTTTMTLCQRQRVTFDAKDVNFYLRLGTIVFGTGSMVQDGFRFSQLLQDGQLSFRCLTPLDIVVITLHIIFTFFQTFYLFKSHKIVVHHHKGFARFGFIQLIATNVCVAILTIIGEIHADVIVTHDTRRHSNETGVTCVLEENLSWKASPYLYPCTVQYSIVAVAVVCQMHRNISTAHARPADELRFLCNNDNASTRDANDDVTIGAAMQPTVANAVDCDKAHKGLFLGLLVVVLTLVAISCFFVFGTGSNYFYSAEDATYYSGFIFFFADLTLLFLSTLAVAVGFAKFRHLRFSPAPGDQLETALLVFALSGVIAMKCFHSVSAVSSIRSLEDVSGMLSVSTSAAILVQVLLQSVFLVDTIRRSVSSPVQQRRKPGRALVTFLLLCNASLLTVSVFEVKKTENQLVHFAFYGQLAWSAISHFTVPLHIFYRFHSIVCLSVIWKNAYRLDDK